MSTHTSSSADEMDLTDVFSLFKRTIYRVLALIFRAIDFMIKFWWVILLLVVIGVLLGLFTKAPTPYRATLIVKTNYKTQPYIYNAIEQFDKNLRDHDVAFMESVGLNPADPGIGGITIEPVIDVVPLMEEIRASERTLGVIISELEIEDDLELFASDRFYSNYRYHKLTVGMSSEAAAKNIENLIAYINDQPIIQKLQEVAIVNMKDRIAQNEQTLKRIDEALIAFGAAARGEAGSNLSYFYNQNTLEGEGIFEFKTELAKETERLKNDLITYDHAAVIVSDIQTAQKRSLLNRREIVYPFLLVFLFLFAAAVRYTYVTLRAKVAAQQLLD